MSERTKGAVAADGCHVRANDRSVVATTNLFGSPTMPNEAYANAARLAAGWNLLVTLQEVEALETLEAVQELLNETHGGFDIGDIISAIRTALSPSTSSGLEPCPFCGAPDEDLEVTASEGGGLFFVRCEGCHTEGPSSGTPEGAADLWNWRVG